MTSNRSTALPASTSVTRLVMFVLFLTIFVLISQSRMARQAERRSHLDFQVGMLSELMRRELTMVKLA
jgi:uncharacterized membrane protein